MKNHTTHNTILAVLATLFFVISPSFAQNPPPPPCSPAAPGAVCRDFTDPASCQCQNQSLGCSWDTTALICTHDPAGNPPAGSVPQGGQCTSTLECQCNLACVGGFAKTCQPGPGACGWFGATRRDCCTTPTLFTCQSDGSCIDTVGGPCVARTTACTSPPAGECLCGQKCFSNQCASGCFDDRDCPTSQTCSNGFCSALTQNPCTTNVDCYDVNNQPAGKWCQIGGSPCNLGGQPQSGCTCATGCEDDTPSGNTCLPDYICAPSIHQCRAGSTGSGGTCDANSVCLDLGGNPVCGSGCDERTSGFCRTGGCDDRNPCCGNDVCNPNTGNCENFSGQTGGTNVSFFDLFSSLFSRNATRYPKGPDQNDPLVGGPGTGKIDLSILKPGNFSDFMGLLNTVFTYLVYFAIPLAVIVFIIAGIMILTSQGESGKLETGKKILLWGVVGFVIVLLAKGILAAILAFLT